MTTLLVGLTLTWPLGGALIIWMFDERRTRARSALATMSAGGTGLTSLALLVLPLEGTAYITKSLAFFALLTVVAGCLVLAGRAWLNYRDRDAGSGSPYALWLLSLSGLIGVSILPSMLLVYLSFCLLVASIYCLMTRNDLVKDIQADVREHRERDRYDVYG